MCFRAIELAKEPAVRLSGGITGEELAVWDMDYKMATIQVCESAVCSCFTRSRDPVGVMAMPDTHIYAYSKTFWPASSRMPLLMCPRKSVRTMCWYVVVPRNACCSSSRFLLWVLQELTYKLQNLEALYVTYARRYDLHAASIAILNLRRLPVRVVARLFSDRPSHSLHLRSNTSRELKSTGKPLSCRYSHLHSWRRRTRFLQLCRTRSRPLPTA